MMSSRYRLLKKWALLLCAVMIIGYWIDFINPLVMFSTIFFGRFFALIEYKSN